MKLDPAEGKVIDRCIDVGVMADSLSSSFQTTMSAPVCVVLSLLFHRMMMTSSELLFQHYWRRWECSY